MPQRKREEKRVQYYYDTTLSIFLIESSRLDRLRPWHRPPTHRRAASGPPWWILFYYPCPMTTAAGRINTITTPSHTPRSRLICWHRRQIKTRLILSTASAAIPPKHNISISATVSRHHPARLRPNNIPITLFTTIVACQTILNDYLRISHAVNQSAI